MQMKKLVLSTLLFFIAGYIQHALAQSAASDHKVPLTTPTPQANPGIGVNAINAPALNVPTPPPVQTLNTPGVINAGVGAVPSIPSAPAPPPAPPIGTLPPVSTFTTTLNLPLVPVLPPVPPIPAMPDVRLPIGSR